MDFFSLSFVFVILVLLLISFFLNRKATGQALKIGYKHFKNIALMFLAMFLLIGLFEVFLPPSLIQKVMGKGTGIFAPLIGAVLGGIAAGPPPVIYPIGNLLLTEAASYGAVAALITAWVSVGTVSLPAEMKIMGKRFALSRWGLTFIFSILIGIGTGILVVKL
ncbi:MAG: permease [Actinobacteria bacterium]|nr:MAG: permease [Actinomycetota bacterium]